MPIILNYLNALIVINEIELNCIFNIDRLNK